MSEKTNGKKTLVASLGALALAITVGGTIAYMTSTSTVTNTFTKGSISVPENKPNDPGDGTPGDPLVEKTDDPIEEQDEDDPTTTLTGNIYEEFKQNSKIGFDSTVAKKAYVGLGKGSESAYVFAKVDNGLFAADSTDGYFVLGNGWKAVDGQATAKTGVNNAYVSGLFVYVGSGTAAKLVEPTETAGAYTTPLLSEVVVGPKTGGDLADNPKVDVSCFIYAPTSGETADNAQTAAIAWATA